MPEPQPQPQETEPPKLHIQPLPDVIDEKFAEWIQEEDRLDGWAKPGKGRRNWKGSARDDADGLNGRKRGHHGRDLPHRE